MFIALTFFTGTAVTMLFWPTWYARVPLVRWFVRWVHHVANAGRAKSPVAAWREARAGEGASPRWRAPRRVPSAYANVRREYCDRGEDDAPVYCQRGCASDEHETLPAARERARIRLSALARLHLVRAHLASTPGTDVARRYRLLTERAQLLTMAVRFACGGPGDGHQLSNEASAALMRTIFGAKQPDR